MMKIPSAVMKLFLNMGLPILGICYGMQLMTIHFDGKVEKAKHREYGKAAINVEESIKLIHRTA